MAHDAKRPPHTSHHKKRSPDEYSAVLKSSGETSNPFSAYCPKPSRFHFESQDPHEKVLMLLRKHPMTNIPWMILGAAMILAPSLLRPLIPFLDLLPFSYQLIMLLGWYLLTAAMILQSALSWLFNVYIITDERVVDVDFYSLIYKRISHAKIDNIEDITSETGGALRSLFDFGNVLIQTAGERREFEFEDVPHPGRVTQLLNELMLEEEQEKLEGRAR